MTTTGMEAWALTYRLTEPITAAANPPIPRRPTTMMLASCDSSRIACAACPWTTRISTSTSVYPAEVSMSVTFFVTSRPAVAVTSGSGSGTNPRARPETGGTSHAYTARSVAPVRRACSAAQHSAARDESDPSVPTTMVGLAALSVIADLLPRTRRVLPKRGGWGARAGAESPLAWLRRPPGATLRRRGSPRLRQHENLARLLGRPGRGRGLADD